MKLVFSSFPDFSDNSFAILNEVLAQKLKVECYWLLSDTADLPEIFAKGHKYFGDQVNKVHFVRKNSPKGIFHYLTANFIFETHGMFEQFPKLPWQHKINLWHGMPLKKIGRLSGNPIRLKMDLTLSTSPAFDSVISKAFEVVPDKVMKVGLPRNDAFFATKRFDFSELFNNHDSVIAWMPTYRQSDVGDVRTDGVQQEYSIGGLGMPDLLELDRTLVKLHRNLVIKLHPMDVLNESMNQLPEFKRICILTKADFEKLNVEVTDFLAATAGLVTDYSSVYFDYILTSRPIGILQLDEEEYANGRGFVSNEIASNFSGFKIGSLTEFEHFLELNADTTIPDLLSKQTFFDAYDCKGKNSLTLLRKLGLLRFK